jgi:hypothetical protein
MHYIPFLIVRDFWERLVSLIVAYDFHFLDILITYKIFCL